MERGNKCVKGIGPIPKYVWYRTNGIEHGIEHVDYRSNTLERAGGLKRTKMLTLNNPDNRDDKDSDSLAHSRYRGSYTWTTCVEIDT